MRRRELKQVHSTWRLEVLVSAVCALLVLALWYLGMKPFEDVRWLSAVVFTPFLRVAGRQALNGGRPSKSSVLILGSDHLAGSLRRELASADADGGGSAKQFGIVEYSPSELDKDGLRDLILSNGYSDVVVTDPNLGVREEIAKVLLECKSRGVRITPAPDFYEGINKKVWLEASRAEDFLYSDTLCPSASYAAAKRVLDLLCAVSVFLITLPLMAIIAVAIKLDSPGPVLFRQERIGRFGVPFMLYKFRSMRDNAEGDTGPVWAKAEDDRVTRIGRFLRRTHLDEVPQIFNVLKNELSFVGPRPERECFIQTLEEQIPLFRLREYVKPGITGWAQVSFSYGDSIETCYEKLQYDLYYAKHASLLFDLKILLKTVRHVVFQGGR